MRGKRFLHSTLSGKEVNKKLIILHPDTSIKSGGKNSAGVEEAKAKGNQF